MTASSQRVSAITIGLFLALAVGSFAATIRPSTPAVDNGTPASPPTEHVILFVLEGFSQESLKGATMPTLSFIGSLACAIASDGNSNKAQSSIAIRRIGIIPLVEAARRA